METIQKTIIKADQLKKLDIEKLMTCDSCKSPLFYIEVAKGIVAEDKEYQIVNYKDKRSYQIREIALMLICAECGDFKENYFYDNKKIVFEFDSEWMDEDEINEIGSCLNQFNQKRKFTPRFKSAMFLEIKKKLEEYDKKYSPNEKRNKAHSK